MKNLVIRREIDKKTAELKIIVPVDPVLWKKEQTKAFNKLAKKVKVPGFRPGKAPEKELKKHVPLSSIWEEAISKLLNMKIKDAVEQLKEDDVILDKPTFAVDKVSEDELEITYIYPVMLPLELKDYKNLKIKYADPTAQEIQKEADKQIEIMLSEFATLVPKEGKDSKVEKGDTIIFDFKGFMDDVAFDGGEAQDYELKIGSNAFIPGFEDALVGKTLGWEGDIEVTFPEDYYKEDFQSRQAKFKIKIKEIKYEDKPKVDDDFIKQLNKKDVKTVEDLKTYLTTISKRNLQSIARDEFMKKFLDKVIAENEIPAPKTVILNNLNDLLSRFRSNLKEQDITEKEYYEITGYDEQKVREELKAEATRRVKTNMLETFLVKDLKITPTEEDFLRHYQYLSSAYPGISGEDLQRVIKRETIEPQVTDEVLIDTLIKLNNPKIKLDKDPVTIKALSPDEVAKTPSSDKPAPEDAN